VSKRIPSVASKERVQALDPGDTALSASSADYEFHPNVRTERHRLQKEHVSQRPPISYALSKDETSMKASRETIKMKTPEGEVKVAVLGDSPGPEEYLQHINNFI
jgi:hypothetical protein